MINTDSLHTFYNSRSWRRLSHEVMRTQHNECQMCKAQGKYSKAVVVHHVNYIRKRPDLAYSRTYIDSEGKEHKQLIALCHECHEKIHERGAYKKINKNNFLILIVIVHTLHIYFIIFYLFFQYNFKE